MTHANFLLNDLRGLKINEMHTNSQYEDYCGSH